jgi:hypothetical protein
MDFWNIMNSFIVYFQDNILITIAFACVLLFLLYWKPRVFLIILCIVLLLAGILYIISDVTSTGVPQKQKLIQEEDIL